jgi:uncharacterized protein (TIGR03086 family)
MDASTMAAACASTRRFVEQVTPDQLSLSTPCSEWDVRSLLSHLVGTLSLGEALLSDSASSYAMTPGGLPEGDVLGTDPIEAYGRGMQALLAVATDDAFGRMHSTPMGEMPGAMLGGFTALDIAVHGWDLAVAIGQDPTLDDDLAAAVLAFARQALTAETRAPRIGPEIPVESASITDRLAGFLGRTP